MADGEHRAVGGSAGQLAGGDIARGQTAGGDIPRCQTDRGEAPGEVLGEVLGVAVRDNDWFKVLDRDIYLTPGRPAPDLLRVPAGDAQRILRQTVRAITGAPKDAASEIVWVDGVSALLVRPGGLELTASAGLITVGVPVACDQLTKDAVVTVPFAVGTEDAPSGLVMSTLTRPGGPSVVVDGWAEALTAFAWEALVHLARSLCAAAGRDSTGAPLLPAYLGAARDVLLLQPMAAHRRSPRSDAQTTRSDAQTSSGHR